MLSATIRAGRPCAERDMEKTTPPHYLSLSTSPKFDASRAYLPSPLLRRLDVRRDNAHTLGCARTGARLRGGQQAAGTLRPPSRRRPPADGQPHPHKRSLTYQPALGQLLASSSPAAPVPGGLLAARSVQGYLLMLTRMFQQSNRNLLGLLLVFMSKDMGFGMSEKGSLLSAIAVGYLFTQVAPK